MSIPKLVIYYNASYREKESTKDFVVTFVADIFSAFNDKKEPKVTDKTASEIIAKAEELKNQTYRTVTQ